MLSEKAIKEVLSGIKGIPLKRSFYRSIGIEYLSDPLDAVHAKAHGGRYNFRQAFGVLYMAPDPHTAIKEVSKNSEFKFPPKALITIEVDIQSVINLEDDAIRAALQVEKGVLLSPWRARQDLEDTEAPTQFLGRMIYETKRFEGILYPSAIDSTKYNLAVFPDRLKHNSVIHIYDPEKILKQSIRK